MSIIYKVEDMIKKQRKSEEDKALEYEVRLKGFKDCI
jgi:hypothetical protein